MICLRRSTVALLGATVFSIQAQVPSWSLEAQQRLIGGPGTDVVRQVAERQRLAEEGEAALSRNDPVAAERAFDAAARIVHSADVEMGLVRTYMQAGEYRRALAFAAHAAGAHRNVPAAAAQYAWLLQIGGQGVLARRLIEDAVAVAPDDTAVRAMQNLLTTAGSASASPSATQPAGVLLAPPMRIAPIASAPLPDGAQVAGTAVLLADGLSALAPSASVARARHVWLRNGLGQTVAAQVDPVAPSSPLVRLRLSAALPVNESLLQAPAAPFAGSLAYTVEYSATTTAEPAWPLLHAGFVGRWLATPGDRLLGIDLPAGPRGGPVLDGHCRLIGISVPGFDGRDRLLPLVNPEVDSLSANSTPSSALPLPRATEDALYESAMRSALQLLVVR